MSQRPPPLTYEEIVAVLQKLDRLPAVLVGGQALNFWAEEYVDTEPQLRPQLPLTSKDIDFQGDHDAAKACAKRIGGTAVVKPIFRRQAGVVRFVDQKGFVREIDFIPDVGGLKCSEVERSAIPVEHGGVHVSVMSPVLCFVSRSYNVIRLRDDYDNPQGNQQLRASFLCARAFIRHALRDGHQLLARRSAHRLLKFCGSNLGRKLLRVKGIDAISAIPLSSEFDDGFKRIGFPRAVADIIADRHRRRVRRDYQDPVIDVE